jgi:hypothetical protein
MSNGLRVAGLLISSAMMFKNRGDECHPLMNAEYGCSGMEGFWNSGLWWASREHSIWEMVPAAVTLPYAKICGSFFLMASDIPLRCESMKRSFAAPGLVALSVICLSCDRSGTSARSLRTPTHPPVPIWLDAQITSSSGDYYEEGTPLAAHRFVTASGNHDRYEKPERSVTPPWFPPKIAHRSIRLDVAPKYNGDGTITIASTLTEGFDTKAPVTTEAPSVTVVAGHAATHQVGGIRFTFLATTDPRYFEIMDPAPPSGTFLEGTYAGVTGQSYIFDCNQVATVNYSDTGPPELERGRYLYRVDDESITLSFGITGTRVVQLKHGIVDGVHLVWTENPGGSRNYSILVSSAEKSYDDWWRSLCRNHPVFADLH